MAHEDPGQIMADVGRRIAEVRRSRGLTQEKASELLGISLKAYQFVERGRQNLTLETLVRVANALDIRVIELFEPPASREVRRGRPRSR